MTDFRRINVIEFAERCITTSCYTQLFCSTLTDEEEIDLEVQKHIKNLNWISSNDLNSPIDFYQEDVSRLLIKAIKGTQNLFNTFRIIVMEISFFRIS